MCDSLNLSDTHIESIFIHSSHYSIETVKSRAVFKPELWSKSFGKSLKKNIIEAKIITTPSGLKIPLKTFAVSPLSQTVEFAGLYGHNERSELLVITLDDLRSQLGLTRVTRIDIAIDFEGDIPKSIINKLSKNRKPFKYRNTTYYKTAKEKKTNQRMDIKIYNKAHQAKLDYPLMRLEFVFKPKFLNGVLFKDIDLAIKKMEKSIKKATGLSVKIQSI